MVTQRTVNGQRFNESLSELSWRLVHDGESVLMLLQTSGTTSTINTLFTASTESACRAEIARLGLVEPVTVEPSADTGGE